MRRQGGMRLLALLLVVVIAAVAIPAGLDALETLKSNVTIPDSGGPTPATSVPASPTSPPALADAPSAAGPGAGVLATIGQIAKMIALALAACVAIGGVALAWSVRRRLRNRKRRVYRHYDIHLSMHDEAKPADLKNMVEQFARIVRTYRFQRFSRGQPIFCLDLFLGYGPGGDMEWSPALLCEPRHVKALEAAVQAAYPDVRIGHLRGLDPMPIDAPPLPVPGALLRLRKARNAIMPINLDADELASPPIEAIAQAQVALGVPSAVRIMLIPTMQIAERWARRRYDAKANELAREAAWGFVEAGNTNARNREDMVAGARRTQDFSLFWMDIQVAADTLEHANQLAAAVGADRGPNTLVTRWMRVREGLYRRRFPRARPPLWPSPSLRTLFASPEVAALIELPTARMRGVPVRRMTVPRVPAPPEILRTSAPPDLELPPDFAGPDEEAA